LCDSTHVQTSQTPLRDTIAEYTVGPSQFNLLGVLPACETLECANENLWRLTGIRQFFPSNQVLAEFRRLLKLPTASVQAATSREWGDFQTPPALAAQVCRYLVQAGVMPRVIIEPTFGAGNFILAALRSFPTTQLVYGVEIQEKYAWHLKLALLTEALRGKRGTAEVVLHQDDIFTHRFPNEVLTAQDVLIIGNPPWVTNAELGALDARNLPVKRNLKALKGMDALTGKSNFDIGEFVLLRMLDLFSGQRGTLAMLCKNSVIKNLMEILPQRRYGVSHVRALEIDARREFGATVEASLLVIELGALHPTFTCQVATLDQSDRITRTFGWTHGRFVANVQDYEANADLDGESSLIWRQGVKHDCARVMELEAQNERWFNGDGEVVDIEDQWTYWLLKSSDLRQFEVSRARKKVILPQHHLDEDTSALQEKAPRLWVYLVRHSEDFDKRRSCIYRNRPRFAVFGVGEYSFKPYKVAISGLYKEPLFSLVTPMEGRPVLLDDTCYFLGFDMYLDALFTASILNSARVKQFLQSIVFTDAKRPYTKEALMRIDLDRAARQLSFQALCACWANLGYEPRVSVAEADFEVYKRYLSALYQKPEGLQFALDV
jgi:hypothetical protein